MTLRRLALGSAAMLALAACSGGNGSGGGRGDAAKAGMPEERIEAEDVSASGGAVAAALAGATPMAQRVAVLGVLNKRNGESRDITLRPGQAVRIGDLVVRLRACEHTAPWEAQELTGAFVQVDVRQPDESWRRVFSGWLYKERPALNVVQHAVYDVWPKSCAMTFPESGPDTVAAGSLGAGGSDGGAPAASASSASNEAAGTDAAAPSEPSSAAPSNAM